MLKVRTGLALEGLLPLQDLLRTGWVLVFAVLFRASRPVLAPRFLGSPLAALRMVEMAGGARAIHSLLAVTFRMNKTTLVAVLTGGELWANLGRIAFL